MLTASLFANQLGQFSQSLAVIFIKTHLILWYVAILPSFKRVFHTDHDPSLPVLDEKGNTQLCGLIKKVLIHYTQLCFPTILLSKPRDYIGKD